MGAKGAILHRNSDGATFRQAPKALRLQCINPNAPTGSGWWHWVILNIPVLDAYATPAMPGCLMADHVIAKASLVAYYGR
jgi:phosphatidylethanolamine-binding protein (PEBP) family uncharacterized protein